MTTLSTESTRSQASRLSFHFWMTAVMTCLVFAGFGFTYWQPLAAGTLVPAPPVVHLHGLVFSSWMLLLLVQSALINVHKLRLHRSLGTFGIAHATAVLLLGLLLTLLSSRPPPAGPSGDYYNLTYLSLMALVGFGLLFTLAIRQVRNPQNHRRLIIFSIIPLLPPGINRLYMAPLGLTELPLLATYLTMDALVIAMLLHDRYSQGRILPVTMIGAAFVFGQQLLHIPVTQSQAFADFTQMLSGLVYYR